MKNENYRNEYLDPWDQGTYQTGSTNPPKSRSGLIAVLLIAVIFLAGISSILGILNVRLFSALKAQTDGNFPCLCMTTWMRLHPPAAVPPVLRLLFLRMK